MSAGDVSDLWMNLVRKGKLSGCEAGELLSERTAAEDLSPTDDVVGAFKT